MIAEDVRFVTLRGFPLVIIAVILMMLFFAVISVSIRTYVRLVDKVFGLDDALLLAAVIVYTVDTSLAVTGVSVGIGTINDGLNTWMSSEAEKYYIIWITVYVVGVALVKSSVCTTLMRVASRPHPYMRFAVWSLLALTWASFCVTFFGILTFCRPVEANWNTALVTEGKAKCASTETLIGISHTNTATSIVTDVGCMILPGMLLWKTQMRTKAKLQVFGLLSVASVASITTIARAPFISHYNNPTVNLTYYIGYIVLFSCIETGIGCIAASLPSVRRFYVQLRGLDTRQSESTANAKSLVTIGGAVIPGASNIRNHKRVFSNPTDRGATTTLIDGGNGNWERLQDSDSDKGILKNASSGGIRADYTYTIELEPAHVGKNGSS
ncbi:hypothetical protein BX600DRAFT_100885 [Xylariales sp. PMI_506]|nr:hypothetical protein BX600DRAFT_100885 [Xylariales sp. PMI_506]